MGVAKDYITNEWRNAEVMRKIGKVMYNVCTDNNRVWLRNVDQLRQREPDMFDVGMELPKRPDIENALVADTVVDPDAFQKLRTRLQCDRDEIISGSIEPIQPIVKNS